jgi:hypothetical protein
LDRGVRAESTRAAASPQSLEPQLLDDGTRQRLEPIAERNPGSVGYAHHALEVRGHGRRVDHRGNAHPIDQTLASTRDVGGVAVDDSFGERDQRLAVLDTAVVSAFRDRAQVDRLTPGLAARTEQIGVRGGSIEATVERRDAACHELDLRPREMPARCSRVGDVLHLQVVHRGEIEEGAHLVGGEAHGADHPTDSTGRP